MSVKVEVNMKEEYMIDFMMNHAYRTFTGIAGLVIGVVALSLGIISVVKGNIQSSLPMFLIAVLFLYVSPKSAINRAKQQVQKSEMFKKTLEYEFSEEGITVRQDETEALNEWSEMLKVTETRKSMVVYITRVRAIIFPKECMGEKYGDVLKIVRAHMPASKVKVRG